MKSKNKVAEDIDKYQNSSGTSEEPYSKSFTIGGSTRTVAISISDLPLITKQDYKKQPYCVICLRTFSNFFRQHHCRVCANAVCSDCSRSLVNKERACDLCIMRLSNPQQQKKKTQIISTLETLCAYMVYRRNLKMAELQALKSAPTQSTDVLKELEAQEKTIGQLQSENQNLREEREGLERELERVREANAQLQETINQIEKEMGSDIDSYS